MGHIKEFLGIEATLVNKEENLYSPSKAALKVAVKDKTDYDNSNYENALKSGNHKILVIGASEHKLEMQNGTYFDTGNHPVETLVPMLHWEKAGFDFEYASIEGKEIMIEKWALPRKDKAVMDFYNKQKTKLQTPINLDSALSNLKAGKYNAVYIPGGHGALMGLPKSKTLKNILQYAHQNDLFILSICHGPAAFLAAGIDESPEDYIFKDYKIAAFPDSNDKLLPSMGYLPGKLTWFFGEKLENLGVEIVNNLASGTVHRDRNVITGDSPLAANKFGKTAAEALLEKYK